jgi:hypothetical protein
MNKLDPDADGASAQIAVRLPRSLLEALDAEVYRLRRLRPGARVGRSDAIREVLHGALIASRKSKPGTRTRSTPAGGRRVPRR